jgi:hypothetical protein
VRRPNRSRPLKGTAILKPSEVDRTVALLKEAWKIAACQYRDSDPDGQVHLMVLMETITDIVKTLEAACWHRS